MVAMVTSLFAALGSAGGAAAGSAAGAAAGAGAIGATGAAASGLSLLSSLRVGTSVISGLSSFASGRAQQEQDDFDAKNEQLNASNELLTAQQKSNDIQNQYNQTVADQLAVASASGYDVSSGSVVQARTFAQTQADTQTTIVRNGGDMNASLRQARAYALQTQGSQAFGAGIVKGLVGASQGLFDLARLGGPAATQAGN